MSVALLALLAACVPATQAVTLSQATSPEWLRALNVTAMMTNEEKANLTTGVGLGISAGARCTGNTGSVPRLGIESFCFQDGPVGIRGVLGSSVFASQITVGSSWDVDMVYEQSAAIGQEARSLGTQVFLGPVTGSTLGRSPYAGRHSESYGVNPFLNGKHSYHGVKGIQDQGVQAVPKHFIMYEQETNRWTGALNTIAGYGFPSPSNNSNTEQENVNVDDKTFRELYLWPFEESLAAKPVSIMCSYNRVNGTDVCKNYNLLTALLKEELGFGGYVLSDYGATYMTGSTVESANAGLDMDLPGGEGLWGNSLVDLVESGNITQSRLDDMVTRILYGYYATGQDKGFPKLSYTAGTYEETNSKGEVINELLDVRADHDKIIKQIGQESAVLLKNALGNRGLPLLQGARLGIFGAAAGARSRGYNYGEGNLYPANSTNNGTIAAGYGSGAGHFTYLIDPLAAINYNAAENGWQVYPVTENYPGLFGDQSLLTDYDHAIEAADTCLVFVSVYAGEFVDRETLKFDNDGDGLIAYVADRCDNTIVVAQIPGPSDFEVAANHPNVTAILNIGYAGQEVGKSLLSLLDGSVSPSGKLVYTILENEYDYLNVSVQAVDDPSSTFSEGQLIDYHRAEASNLAVRYEFGYGLSYTTFNYSNLEVTRSVMPIASAGHTDVVMTITADVANAGTYNGKEVAQLYVTFPESSGSPSKLLRGFEKQMVRVGESRGFKFDVRKKDISVWNVSTQSWTVPSGQFTIQVGSSSRTLPLTTTFTL